MNDHPGSYTEFRTLPIGRIRPIFPIRPGFLEHQAHDYKRHGTATLFTALDAHNGEVVHKLHAKHTQHEFIAFLNQADACIPDRELHLVVDNYATYKTPLVNEWIERPRRFTLHFTPTASNWNNLVERLFGKLMSERIHRGAFRSVDELNHAIEEWIGECNADPIPFRWIARPKTSSARSRNTSALAPHYTRGMRHFPPPAPVPTRQSEEPERPTGKEGGTILRYYT